MMLYVMEGLECIELAVGYGTVETPWVREKQIKGCHCGSLLPGQDDDTNEIFFRELYL